MLPAGNGHFIALCSIGDELPPDFESKAGLTSYLARLQLALRGPGQAVHTDVARTVEVMVRSFSRRPATATYPKPTGLLNRVGGLRFWFS